MLKGFCWAKMRSVREGNARIAEVERAGGHVFAIAPTDFNRAHSRVPVWPNKVRISRLRSVRGAIQARACGEWFPVCDLSETLPR